MYLKVRSFVPCPNGKSELHIVVSKLTVVSDLKTKISEEVEIDKSLLRLFYLGKELNDNYKVYDYGIKLNDVIQFIVNSSNKKEVEDNKDTENNNSNNIEEVKTNENDITCNGDGLTSSNDSSESEKPNDIGSRIKAESKYYKIGDRVDAKDLEYGAWFEAIIVDICKSADSTRIETTDLEDDLIFKIKFEKRMFLESFETSFQHIRPRSKTTIDFLELIIGDTVLVNYNIEEPEKRGFWYDLCIKRVLATKTKRILEGDIYVGTTNAELGNVKIKILDRVYKIEQPVLLTERDDSIDNKSETNTLRKEAPFCDGCKDNVEKKCKECGCSVCGGKNEPDKILLCDECDMAYHLNCLNPPLEKLPDDDEWFCPDCKTDVNEIVKIGDELKTKKSKKTSVKNNSADSSAKVRDWGHGMACVSRTKICTIVSSTHYGPVPGIEVGMCWKFRMQVSEAGVHRPHVAGIHGRENDGAYSIVLSGGYEDDYDNGETFYYTGSGGRDLSGNKRTAQQSCDQTLTRMNKALALNCNAKLNEKGAEAKNWQGGKPVRVVRNYKLSKHSKFAPEDGNRYDGIYKVVKYWPSKGKSGFMVWRYLLQRDDPEPAPWEENAKKFDMLFPDGYIEAMKVEEEKKSSNKSNTEKQNQKSGDESNMKKGTKRKGTTLKEPVVKKQNTNETIYEIPKDIKLLIDNDKNAGNMKYWKQCEATLPLGKIKFLSEVEEVFKCICCQELVFKPVTTECMHSFCQSCLNRSFAAKLTTCPHCRETISNDDKINENLSKILIKLFPGYDADRS